MTRILVVEDEPAIAEPLGYLLEREGYDVALAGDGAAALLQFHRVGADIILLDLMLPGMSGREVCRTIRAKSDVPIIMLTAKDSETDIVVGLELGADDYVTKPYSSRELLARIGALLRRARDRVVVNPDADDESETLQAGAVRMDIAAHTVTLDGAPVTLPLREFDLLEYLMRNMGRVLTRAQLIDRVWGGDYTGDTKTLDVHVKRLRAHIEPDPARPRMITTVRGVGYRLDG